MLKGILVVTYVVISALLFINFKADIGVWLSFMVNNLILFGIMMFHLYEEKEYSPFISVFLVFSFLFFIVAPITQINFILSKNETFMTMFYYTNEITIKTCAFIALFNIVFFMGYLYFKKSRLLNYKPAPLPGKGNLHFGLIIALVVLSVLTFVVSWGFVQEEISRPSWMESSASIMSLLLWKKVLFLLPYAGVILCVEHWRKHKKNRYDTAIVIIALFIFLMFLLWFKNPLTEKRNALGPIYISLIFLFLPRLLRSNVKTLFFMFFSMVVIFPLSAIITHTSATLNEIRKKPSILLEQFEGEGISNVFYTMHYDAFANIGATLDYATQEGLSNGQQLLGAVFFFVPRVIWEDKPISTGQMIGSHLMDNYGLNYNNLANPMVSEGYINFGILGIVFMALLLAVAVVYLKSWLQSENYLKKIMGFYFAIHLLFLLRGDFMNGFSYYIGTLIGVLIVPRGIYFIFQQLGLNQRTWKKKHAIKA